MFIRTMAVSKHRRSESEEGVTSAPPSAERAHSGASSAVTRIAEQFELL